jgi:hypothetical protein
VSGKPIIDIPTEKLSGFLQAQANRGRCSALRAIGSAAAGTEYRRQRFVSLAAHRAIGFDRPNVRVRGFALVAFIAFRALFTWRALRSLRPLRSGLTLGARHALHALCTLRTRGTLGSRVTFGTWVFAASGERNRNADQ